MLYIYHNGLQQLTLTVTLTLTLTLVVVEKLLWLHNHCHKPCIYIQYGLFYTWPIYKLTTRRNGVDQLFLAIFKIL